MEMQEKLFSPMKRDSRNVKPIRNEKTSIARSASSDNVKPIRSKKTSIARSASSEKNNKEEDWEMAACSSSWNGNERWHDTYNCPVCDQEFDDAAILEIHVNGHFSANNTPGEYTLMFITV